MDLKIPGPVFREKRGRSERDTQGRPCEMLVEIRAKLPPPRKQEPPGDGKGQEGPSSRAF